MRGAAILQTTVVSIALTALAWVGAGNVKGEFATVADVSVEILSPGEMAAIEGKVHTDALFLLAPPRSFFFTGTTQSNPVVDFFPSTGGPLLQIDLSSILNGSQPQRAIALLGPAGLLDFPLGNLTAPIVLIGLNP